MIPMEIHHHTPVESIDHTDQEAEVDQPSADLHHNLQASPLPSPSPSSSSSATASSSASSSNALRWFMIIAAWQVLSVLLTGTGVFSQLLADNFVNIPTSQSFCNYAILALLTFVLIWRQYLSPHAEFSTTEEVRQNDSAAALVSPAAQKESEPVDPRPYRLFFLKLSLPAWKYVILALADVEGNYLLVKAYQYTTITSVQLLDCFTIPCVMVLSRIVFRTRYSVKNIGAALVCLVGLGLLVASDIFSDRFGEQTGDSVALGDGLVLIGCVCYAISNVGQEMIVKTDNRLEYLAMLGLFGSMISAIQLSLTELDNLNQIPWNDGPTVWYLVGFTLCLLGLYLCTPTLLIHSSALVMNLSFLTSDFWSILFAIQLFGATLHWLYFIAFSIIIVGLVVYHVPEKKWQKLLRGEFY